MSTEGPSNPDAALSAAPPAAPVTARPHALHPAALVWLLWMLVWGGVSLAWFARLRAAAHAGGVDYNDGALAAQEFGVGIMLLGVVLVALRRVGLGLGLACLGAVACALLYFSVFLPVFQLWIDSPVIGHLLGWAVGLVNVVVLFVLLRARRAPALSEAPQP